MNFMSCVYAHFCELICPHVGDACSVLDQKYEATICGMGVKSRGKKRHTISVTSLHVHSQPKAEKKAAPKAKGKKGKARDDDDDVMEIDEPEYKPKPSKSRGKKTKTDDGDDDMADKESESKPKPGKARGSKRDKDDGDEAQPAKKSRSKKASKSVVCMYMYVLQSCLLYARRLKHQHPNRQMSHTQECKSSTICSSFSMHIDLNTSIHTDKCHIIKSAKALLFFHHTSYYIYMYVFHYFTHVNTFLLTNRTILTTMNPSLRPSHRLPRRPRKLLLHLPFLLRCASLHAYFASFDVLCMYKYVGMRVCLCYVFRCACMRVFCIHEFIFATVCMYVCIYIHIYTYIYIYIQHTYMHTHTNSHTHTHTHSKRTSTHTRIHTYMYMCTYYI
jgi:hypothetical protein